MTKSDYIKFLEYIYENDDIDKTGVFPENDNKYNNFVKINGFYDFIPNVTYWELKSEVKSKFGVLVYRDILQHYTMSSLDDCLSDNVNYVFNKTFNQFIRLTVNRYIKEHLNDFNENVIGHENEKIKKRETKSLIKGIIKNLSKKYLMYLKGDRVK